MAERRVSGPVVEKFGNIWGGIGELAVNYKAITSILMSSQLKSN